MLRYALAFLFFALLAAILGMTSVQIASFQIAKILLAVFILMVVLSLIFTLARRI